MAREHCEDCEDRKRLEVLDEAQVSYPYTCKGCGEGAGIPKDIEHKEGCEFHEENRGKKYDGPCGRRACMVPGSRWWNTSTRRWYCESCAKRINEANRREAPDGLCIRRTITEMQGPLGPPPVFLDEPAGGLDPAVYEAVKERALKPSSGSVVIIQAPPRPTGKDTDMAVTGRPGTANGPVEGWVNVYASGYSQVWVNEESARGAATDGCDQPRDGYIRTAHIGEFGRGLYTRAQLDAEVAKAKAELNRSAGRSLLDMMNGMGDMARNGSAPSEGSVMAKMEEALQSLQVHNGQLQVQVAERDAVIADLRARFDAFKAKLDEFERAMREGAVDA